MRMGTIAAAVLTAGLAAPAAGQQMVMQTGPIGGAWYPIGTAMVEILQSKAGVTFTQQPGGGVSNAFNVGGNKAQIGFTTSGAAASAIAGSNDFDGRAQKNIRLLGSLFPQQYTLAVWADGPVKTMADLKGRALQTTPRGSSTELMTRRVLEAHGVTYRDLKTMNHSNLNDGVNQMKDGQVDGMSHLITNPAAHVLDLQSSKTVRVMTLDPAAVDKLVKDFPGYVKSDIRAGMYNGQSAAITTVGEPVVLITRAELDADTVYKMTRALVEGRTAMAAVHRIMDGFTAAYAAADPSIEIHPGALRYYREAGAVK